MNALQQLKAMTTIVADTGDLAAIARLKPVDATTNPSLITKALSQPEQQTLLKDSLSRHQGDIDSVIDALTIQIGCDILQLIEGRVSTEVDARLSYDTQGTINKALAFVDAYQQAGVDPQRILIKVAATWEGIKAAEQLEQQGIHCNLTLLFDQHQARACADAGITLISPFVGRIYDWQKRTFNLDKVTPDQDMGVQSVKGIYDYYKQHGYTTEVMGASFRSPEQILALAGCDLLTIAPDLLDALANMDTEVSRQLITSTHTQERPAPLTHAEYQSAESTSAVTQELLPAGIDGFIKAREQLVACLQKLG